MSKFDGKKCMCGEDAAVLIKYDNPESPTGKSQAYFCIKHGQLFAKELLKHLKPDNPESFKKFFDMNSDNININQFSDTTYFDNSESEIYDFSEETLNAIRGTINAIIMVFTNPKNLPETSIELIKAQLLEFTNEYSNREDVSPSIRRISRILHGILHGNLKPNLTGLPLTLKNLVNDAVNKIRMHNSIKTLKDNSSFSIDIE